MKKFKFFILSLCVLFFATACNTPSTTTPNLNVQSVNVVTPTDSTDLSKSYLRAPLLAAADSTPVQLNIQVTSPQPGQTFWAWALKNIAAFVGMLLFIGEILVRWFPTASNMANFAWVSNLLNLIFGNRKLGGGSF